MDAGVRLEVPAGAGVGDGPGTIRVWVGVDVEVGVNAGVRAPWVGVGGCVGDESGTGVATSVTEGTGVNVGMGSPPQAIRVIIMAIQGKSRRNTPPNSLAENEFNGASPRS